MDYIAAHQQAREYVQSLYESAVSDFEKSANIGNKSPERQAEEYAKLKGELKTVHAVAGIASVLLATIIDIAESLDAIASTVGNKQPKD